MEKRTPKRDEGGFHTVFLMELFLNSLERVLEPNGSEYSGVHAAIFLKLPSMAIFPWVVDRLLRKSTIENNAWNPPSSLFGCFVSATTLLQDMAMP